MIRQLETKRDNLLESDDEDFHFVLSVTNVVKALIKKHEKVYSIFRSDNTKQAIIEALREERDYHAEEIISNLREDGIHFHPFGISLILDIDLAFGGEEEILGSYYSGSIFEFIKYKEDNSELEHIILHERIHNIFDPYLFPEKFRYNFIKGIAIELTRFLNSLFSEGNYYRKLSQERFIVFLKKIDRLIKNPVDVIDCFQGEFLADMLIFEKKLVDFIMRENYPYATNIFRRLLFSLGVPFSRLKENEFLKIAKLSYVNGLIKSFLLELKQAKNNLLRLLLKFILETESFHEFAEDLFLIDLETYPDELLEKVESVFSKDEEEIKSYLEQLLPSLKKPEEIDIEQLAEVFITFKPLYQKFSQDFPRVIEKIERFKRKIFESIVKSVFIAHFRGREDELHVFMFVIRLSKINHFLTYLQSKINQSDYQFAEVLFNFYFNFDFSLENLRQIERKKDRFSEDDIGLIKFMFINFYENSISVSNVMFSIDKMSIDDLREYFVIFESLNLRLNFDEDFIEDFKRAILSEKFFSFIKLDIKNNFSNLQSFVNQLNPEERRIFEEVLEEIFSEDYIHDDIVKVYGEEVYGENDQLDISILQKLPLWENFKKIGLDQIVQKQ